MKSKVNILLELDKQRRMLESQNVELMIAKLGGSIRVNTEPGIFTEFTICFPTNFLSFIFKYFLLFFTRYSKLGARLSVLETRFPFIPL